VGKTADQAIERARKDVASVVKKLTAIAHIAVDSLTDDQIREGFGKSTSEAPVWTKMVERIVGSAARGEAAHPNVTNSLNLIMVGRAPDKATWLESVEAAKAKQKQLAAAPIDIIVEEPKK
jgi:hypothetical protein